MDRRASPADDQLARQLASTFLESFGEISQVVLHLVAAKNGPRMSEMI